MIKNTYLLFLLLLFGFTGLMAQTVQIENVSNASPGDISVPVDMLGFTTASGNGLVQSIQFQISFDASLLYFKGIANNDPNFTGWVVPGNGSASPVTISYINMTGHDISGKIFDLKFGYAGGFSGNVNFITAGCEISGGGTLSRMNNVTYLNGTVSQTASSALVDLGSDQQATVGGPVVVPVNMTSPAFTGFTYKIGFDPTKLTFVQASGYSGLSGSFAASASNGVLTVTWNGSPITYGSLTHAFDLKFTYNGGGDAPITFKSGSQIIGTSLNILPTTFAPGKVVNDNGSGSITIGNSVAALNATNVPVPITLNYTGSGFIGALDLKIGYNSSVVTFTGTSTGLISGYSATASGGVIHIVWSNAASTSILSGSPLLNLRFTTIATGLSALTFNAGSAVTRTNLSNAKLDYIDGSLLSGWAVSPATSTINVGGSTSFSVTGDGLSSYKWQFSSNSGTSWTDCSTVPAIYSNYATTTLNITGATIPMNGYQYRCVNNTTSAVSSTATLYVNVIITVGPVSHAVAVGGNTTFSITAPGATGYLWYYSANSGVSWTACTSGGIYTDYTTPTLTITGMPYYVTPYQYKCVAQPTDVPSSAATLTYSDALISLQPANQSVVVLGNTSFSITASGVYSYQWQVSINGGVSFSDLSNGGVYSNVNAATMNIAAAPYSLNSYQYRCALIPGAPVYSNAATLTVLQAQITGQPSNASIFEGGNTSFSVTATGATSYQWQYNDGSWHNCSGGVYGATGTNATLAITGALLSMNSYTYQCIVQPGPVTTLPAKTLTVTAITPPSDQPVNLGANAAFSVTAIGATSYQWELSTNNGVSFTTTGIGAPPYSNATTNTLNITGAVAAMNGYKYRCVIGPAGAGPGTVTSLSATLTVNPLTVNTKVILQGALVPVTFAMPMRTDLNSGGNLPLGQPYTSSPWSYNPSPAVTVGSIPNANVVDWILVELRATATGSPITNGQQVGFLLQDGSIVSIAGSGALSFPGVEAGSYFIVIRHRNHLPIMSASAQALNSISGLYDFTTSSGKAYGTDPMVAVPAGFALWGGDVNKNGFVNYNFSSNDRTALFTVVGNNVVSGYLDADVNMNGFASYNYSSNDRTAIFSFVGNNVVFSQVP